MKNDRRDYRGGNQRSGNSYGKPAPWKRGFGEEKPSFKATCHSCGNSCTVPFKPNGSKPVLCRSCFQASGNASEKRSFNDRPSFRPAFKKPLFDRPASGPNLKDEIRSINDKLDRILALLDE